MMYQSLTCITNSEAERYVNLSSKISLTSDLLPKVAKTYGQPSWTSMQKESLKLHKELCPFKYLTRKGHCGILISDLLCLLVLRFPKSNVSFVQISALCQY